MVLDIKFNTSLSKPKSANTTVSLLLAVLERFWFRDFFYSRDSVFLRFFFFVAFYLSRLSFATFSFDCFHRCPLRDVVNCRK